MIPEMGCDIFLKRRKIERYLFCQFRMDVIYNPVVGPIYFCNDQSYERLIMLKMDDGRRRLTRIIRRQGANVRPSTEQPLLKVSIRTDLIIRFPDVIVDVFMRQDVDFTKWKA